MFKITLLGNFKKMVLNMNKFSKNFSFANDKTDRNGPKNKNINFHKAEDNKKTNSNSKPKFEHYNKPSKKHIERGINFQKEDEEAFRQKQMRYEAEAKLNHKNENKAKINNSLVVEAPRTHIVSTEKNFKSINF
jgi:hypothetical protein